MPEPAASAREQARLLYADRSIPLTEVAVRLGVSTSTLLRLVKEEGWPRRSDRALRVHSRPRATPSGASGAEAAHPQRVDLASEKRERPKETGSASPSQSAESRQDLIDRLYRLVHHNVKLLESRMSDENASDASGPERDMRVVGNLVRSVEKLKELEPEQSKRDNSPGGASRALVTPEEEDLIRRRVVEHILKLRERKRREDGGR